MRNQRPILRIALHYTHEGMLQRPKQGATKPSTLAGILRQRCPRCRAGQIFCSSLLLGLPKMHPRCPICDLKFEREPGYFLGAMYISYAIALGTITLFAVLLWSLTGWSIMKATGWAIVMFLPFAPIITLFARVLWIYLDQAIDPDRSG